jgi:uncharacterized protein (UPF0248 family)
MTEYGLETILFVDIGQTQTAYHRVLTVRYYAEHFIYMSWYYKRDD